MRYFLSKKKNEILQNLLNVRADSDRKKIIVRLQNDIASLSSTKVIAVVPVDESDLAAAFAEAMRITYEENGSKTMLIDANLYHPCLRSLLGNSYSSATDQGHEKMLPSVYCFDTVVYPGDFYKSGEVQKKIKDGTSEYDRVIVITSEIREHKELALLANCLDTTVLVARRGFTKKEDVFNAISFLGAEKIPVSRVVILH